MRDRRGLSAILPELVGAKHGMPVVPAGARHPTLNINSLHGGQANNRAATRHPVAGLLPHVIDRRLLIEESIESVKAEVTRSGPARPPAPGSLQHPRHFRGQASMADRNGPLRG